MDVRDLKLPVVIAVFLVVVAAGVGVQQIYYQKRVIDPLPDDAHAIEGVESVQLVSRGDGLKDVWITLEPGARIEEVYPQVEMLANANLRGIVRARRGPRQSHPRLSEAYHRIHFAVQKGSAPASLRTWLKRSIGSLERKRASSTVFMSVIDMSLSTCTTTRAISTKWSRGTPLSSFRSQV